MNFSCLAPFLGKGRFQPGAVASKTTPSSVPAFTETRRPENKILALRAGRKTIDRNYMLSVFLVQDAEHR